MDVQIEIISDFICPWCYLGKARLERVRKHLLNDDINLIFDLKPYILYPHIPPGGVDKSQLAKMTKRGMGKSLRREARIENIEILYKQIKRIPYSLDAHRFTWMIEDQNLRFDVSKRIFHDYFELGQDIEDKAYLSKVASDFELGQNVSTVLSNPEAAKNEVSEYIRSIFEEGISLVPTLRFGPSLTFPGLQPFDVWVNYIRRAAKMQNQN